MKIIILILGIGIAISNAKTLEEAQREEQESISKNSTLKYSKIFNNLLIGFDCMKPKNITSHQFDDFQECENPTENIKTQIVRLQILQHSRRYINEAIYCSSKRTRKFSDCGSMHHSAPLHSYEFVMRPIPLDPAECQQMYDRRTYYPSNKSRYPNGFQLDLSKINRISYYLQGNQYPGCDTIGITNLL